MPLTIPIKHPIMRNLKVVRRELMNSSWLSSKNGLSTMELMSCGLSGVHDGMDGLTKVLASYILAYVEKSYYHHV